MKGKAVTLIEILVVIAVLGIVSASFLATTITWRRAWDVGAIEMDVQAEARRAIRRISGELMQATSTDSNNDNNILITPNRPPNQPARDTISFRMPTGYDTATGAVVWGNKIQYSLDIANTQVVRADLDAPATEIVGSYINGLQFDINQGVLQIMVTATKNYRGSSDIQKAVVLNSQVNLRN